MISSERGYNLLVEAGLTPVQISGKDSTYFFIEKQVVWAKLFTTIKKDPELKEALEAVKHLKWLENIIYSRNPELEEVRINGKRCFAIKFTEIQSGKYKHIDERFQFIFAIVGYFLNKLINQFS